MIVKGSMIVSTFLCVCVRLIFNVILFEDSSPSRSFFSKLQGDSVQALNDLVLGFY